MDLVENSIGKRVASLEDAAKAFDTWHTKMDATVEELRAEVDMIRKTDEKVETLREEMTALCKSVSRSVLDAAPAIPSGVLQPPPKVSTTTIPTSWTKFSPIGHHKESSHRGFEFPAQSLVKGTLIPPNPDPKPKLLRSYSGSALMVGVPNGSGGGDGFPRCTWHGDGVPDRNWHGAGTHEHIPKMNFPPFDGENPKLWLGRCLDYFDMYTVPHRRWVKVANMHMTAAAARWLQSVEDHIHKSTWEFFCQAVMERFGKD
jgi:hypothetical protein